MALRKTLQISGDAVLMTEYGQLQLGKQEAAANCYIKVEAVSGGKESAVASVLFQSDTAVFTQTYEFVPDMDGPNFIKQAYEHLKTLPEFSSAEDV
jgi:hypothetical protein